MIVERCQIFIPDIDVDEVTRSIENTNEYVYMYLPTDPIRTLIVDNTMGHIARAGEFITENAYVGTWVKWNNDRDGTVVSHISGNTVINSYEPLNLINNRNPGTVVCRAVLEITMCTNTGLTIRLMNAIESV